MTISSSRYKAEQIAPSLTDAKAVPNAQDIPPLAHAEAGQLMREEVQRTLGLLNSLSEEDWSKPTACTLWNVHQLTCHLTGALAGYASRQEFYHQYLNLRAARRYRRTGLSLLDALNQLQVDDRAKRPPAALIAELAHVAPKAINTRQNLPGLLRVLHLPIPVLGFVRLDYLTDTIYPRDMWMHRVDISQAVGKRLVLTPEHDGRIIALVIRDLAFLLPRELGSASIAWHLSGIAGGRWRIGTNPTPSATIAMDAIDFARLASGRIKSEEAQARSVIHGSQALAEHVLLQTTVPF